jgi:poly(A) polymerase
VADALIRPIQAVPAAFAGKPLNLVKVAKHAAYHGYDVAPEVREQAMKFAINVLDVQPERVRPELERLLVNVFPDKGLTFLEETGVLRYILPEVQAMVGFSDTCYLHHKDIWEHTKTVVFRSKPHAAIRWAALLHDIGKVWTRTVDQRGRVHFFRHEEMSAMMFKGIAARFGLEERLAARAQFLVLHHSRINMYTKEWTDSAVRRLIRETGDNLEDLLSLSKADITSRQERRVGELEQLLTELERRIRAIREEDSRAPPLPSGTGDAIMRHFGLQPGPVVGQLRQVLEEAVERGQVERGLPMEKYLEFLQDYVRTHG